MSQQIKTRAPTANIPPFGLRMQPEMKERVEKLAKASGRSMNAQILHMIQWYFDEIDRLEADYKARQEYEEHMQTARVEELEPLERLQREFVAAQSDLFKKLAKKHGITIKDVLEPDGLPKK